MEPEAEWTAARRIEGWAGEVRVNLIRVAAVAAFYGHHLLNHFLSEGADPAYHRAVTGLAVGWAAVALALHVGLSRRWNPPYVKYAALAFDASMATAVLVLSGGPTSSLLVILFLLIATAPLRLQLRAVWAATLFAVLSYAFVCGHARWVKPEWRVPRREQVIFALGLGTAGLLAGQSVRQALRFARDYADRFKPETPA